MNSVSPSGQSIEPPKRKNPFVRLILKFVLGSVVLYGAVLAFLLLNETNLVYPGAQGESNWNPDFQFEEVWVESTNDARIHGWFLARPNTTRNVLLFHGNGEDVAQVSDRYARKVGEAIDANVLVFDYRGFGKSKGTPSEELVIDDGEAMLAWLLNRGDAEGSEDQIIYFGSSLGAGVAIGLSERHPPDFLVIDRTFDAITSAAAQRYPWAPVKMLMRNKFNSLERTKHIDVPMFQSHFVNDELCSLESARKLFEAAKSRDKYFHEMPKGGHYHELPREYWETLSKHFQGVNAGSDDLEHEGSGSLKN